MSHFLFCFVSSNIHQSISTSRQPHGDQKERGKRKEEKERGGGKRRR
jgi:hypothetical protein